MNLAPTLLHSLSLVLLFLLVSSSSDEVRSLLEFKKGIKSDPQGKVLNSWNHSFTVQSFAGVVCNDAGNVTAIVLDGLGLVGDLKFATLIGLQMLKNLSLSGNSFTGRLVPAIGSITSLQHLDLSGNQFYGPIPARVNDLWGLDYLNLSSNNFTGQFPAGIRNLQQLKALDLHSNRLRGDIQELFAELRNVEYLDLSYNMFSGSLAMDLQNVSSLANTARYLNLSHNMLSGGFFRNEVIQLFKNLQVLDLGDNVVSGELPSFRSLLNLRVLRLGSNQLYGPIVEELLESLMSLEELDLGDNGFSGPIHLINSTTLSILNLSSNALSGSLPSTVGRCLIVDLSRNMLSGDVSAMQSWEANVEFLDLSSNKFSGSIPDLTSKFQSLTTLNMKNNSLAGTLLLGSYPRLSTVDLSLNEFRGLIPPSFFTSMTLTYLNLSGNHFTGSIPLQGLQTSELLVPPYPQMESLDLSDNSLTGTLNSAIGELGRLKLLNLAENGLSGHIPYELSKLSFMEYLDLSRNNFKYKIPDKLPWSLKVFNVSYNDLSGPVPENLINFPVTSFHPGNPLLIFPNGFPFHGGNPVQVSDGRDHPNSKFSIRVAIIVASVGAAVMIAFVLFAYRRAHFHNSQVKSGLSGETAGGDVKSGRFSRPSFLSFQTTTAPPPTSSGFANDHLLHSNSRSLSIQMEFDTEIVEHVPDNCPVVSERKSSSDSPVSSSPRFIDAPPPTSSAFANDHLLHSNSRSLSIQMEFDTEIVEHVPDNCPVVSERKSSSDSPVSSSPRFIDAPPPTSSGFANDHLLHSNSRSLSIQMEFDTEIVEHVPDNCPVVSERKSSSDCPVSSSPRFIDAIEQPVTLYVNSPDLWSGELSFVDVSLEFTAEELSRAPAEVLGLSSLGTLYRAFLDSGHVLAVKLLRVGLLNKKEFTKEVKKIGSMRHPTVVPLRACYCGPREQERLILADYVRGYNLALHLYGTTPRTYSRLSFSQRLKVAVDIAQSLSYLHDRGLPHGNLKPTNIILVGTDLNAVLTDYGLHILMTPPGIADLMLNLGALGYRAPELATVAKPVPSMKSDVYAFGVILMELLTRRSADDIISGQSGAVVDLTDWVRLCNQEGRGMDCIDRDIASGEEEQTRGVDELLAISLRCILPVNERPYIRQILEDLCSIHV